MPQRVGGQERVVAQFAKNRREVVRISLGEFGGHALVNIRAWAPSQDGSTFIPTKAGLALRIELLGELIDSLEAARAVCGGGDGRRHD
jgi:hypothetical protein